MRPKNAVDPTKQDGVAYKISCECDKVYIGETVRPMHKRIKKQDRDIWLARNQTSAVSDHTNEKVRSDKAKLIARKPHWHIRWVKRPLYHTNINKNNEMEIPEAWMPTITQHNSRSVPLRTSAGTTLKWNCIRIEMQQTQKTTVLFITIHSQSTISPEED